MFISSQFDMITWLERSQAGAVVMNMSNVFGMTKKYRVKRYLF